MTFLFETSTIQNLIVNCTALTFILNIDELLFSVLESAQTKHLLEILQGYHPSMDLPEDEKPNVEEMSEEAILEHSGMMRFWQKGAVPWMLVISIIVWLYFIWVYYSTHCLLNEDGLVSKPMYLPKSEDFGILEAVLPQFFP